MLIKELRRAEERTKGNPGAGPGAGLASRGRGLRFHSDSLRKVVALADPLSQLFPEVLGYLSDQASRRA